MPTEQNPLIIDTHRLDVEWLKQPGLSRSAGRQQADAQHAYNQAKAKREVTYAKVLLQVRRTPLTYNLREKPNEEEVICAVKLTKEYQDALAAEHQAELELGYAKADTVATCHDRRRALEMYVELLSMNYISEREPRATNPKDREALKNRERREVFGGGIDLDDDTLNGSKPKGD